MHELAIVGGGREVPPGKSAELRRRAIADINADAHGAKLGGERDLAERYGTSRSRLRQVLAALEEAGSVHRAVGRSGGIFISHDQLDRTLSDLVGLPQFLARQGHIAGARVLSTSSRNRTPVTSVTLRGNDRRPDLAIHTSRHFSNRRLPPTKLRNTQHTEHRQVYCENRQLD